MRHSFVLILSLFLAACGSDTTQPVQPDATPDVTPDAGAPLDGGPSCNPDFNFDPNLQTEDVSSFVVLGLYTPMFDISHPPADQEKVDALDSNRLYVEYNGLHIIYDSLHRIYRSIACNGPASVDVRFQGAEGDFVTHLDWEAEAVTIPDPGSWRSYYESGRTSFLNKGIAVFGKPGEFSFKTFTYNFNAPENGGYRFHIANGADAKFSARLISAHWDPDDLNQGLLPDEEPTYTAPIVTDLASGEVAIVDVVTVPQWDGLEAEMPWTLIEYWFGDDFANRETSSIILPIPADAIFEGLLASIPYRGTIYDWLVYPNRNQMRNAYLFSCRDPFWKAYFENKGLKDCGDE